MKTLENIKLDEENVEFNKAADFVNLTDKMVYLTGKAGTGKTTFLKYVRKTTKKNTIIVAPTGVAAINAGGVTINSFFQLPYGPFVPNDTRLRTHATGSESNETIYSTFVYKADKRKIIENLELLIIDEVSMVRADTLDVINKILKVFRKKTYLPFGGVQVVLIGDTFQLPPIVDKNHWSILSQFYKTPFFFSAHIFEESKPLYIELKKIYRQSETEFIELLNRVRVSKVTQSDINGLNAKYDPDFSPKEADYITLATHNSIVNRINSSKLEELEKELFTYEGKVEGTFPDDQKPTDHFLKLKEGAQVMFIKNDTSEIKRYFNGKIGKIKQLKKEAITVVFDDENEVKVGMAEWENIQYTYDKENKRIVERVVGTFSQFPLRLAWAITVHKSQGLTFEKVIADLGAAFASGQVYVALSRCTSLSGLVLKSPIGWRAIKTDYRVLEFAKNETPDTLVAEELNKGKADFYYKSARDWFNRENINEAFKALKNALKFRNDIDTLVFQKYIETKGKRLISYKNKYDVLSEKHELANNELLEANLEIEQQYQKIQMLKNEVEDFRSTVLNFEEKYKSEITLLKEQKMSLKCRLEVAQKKCEELKLNASIAKKELKEKESDYDYMESVNRQYKFLIDNLNKKNGSLQDELATLRKLKWYDLILKNRM